MLEQPTAKWMADRQSSTGPLLNAQPHRTEEPTNGSDAHFSTATGLAVVLLTVFHTDSL